MGPGREVLLRAVLLLLAVIGLAGCYQTGQAVITRENSARIPGLAGQVRTGEKLVSVFRHDPVAKDYHWQTIKQGRVAKSGRLRALSIRDDVWLLQFREAKSRPVYMLVFYRFSPAERRLQVLLPDRKVGQLKTMAGRFGVMMDENHRLSGRRQDILRFLMAHGSLPFVAAR